MIDIAYVPTMCNHCDNAPCIAKARTTRSRSATTASSSIDPVKAKGRKDLVDACPYGHIWWNEELQLPQTWPFDAHLHRPGLAADARPAGLPDRRDARDQGRGRRDGAHGARAKSLEVMKPELGTKPRVYYRNLWRYSEMLHRRLASRPRPAAWSIASRAPACG